MRALSRALLLLQALLPRAFAVARFKRGRRDDNHPQGLCRREEEDHKPQSLCRELSPPQRPEGPDDYRTRPSTIHIYNSETAKEGPCRRICRIPTMEQSSKAPAQRVAECAGEASKKENMSSSTPIECSCCGPLSHQFRLRSKAISPPVHDDIWFRCTNKKCQRYQSYACAMSFCRRARTDSRIPNYLVRAVAVLLRLLAVVGVGVLSLA